MKGFFEKNKIFIAIIIAGLIIGGAIYFGLTEFKKESQDNRGEVTECLAPSEVIVTKIIDGDTIVVEGGYHIRLLGIDADESGYPCYGPAKTRLEELVLSKEVRLEKDETDIDQYGRCLRYIFLDDQNIDLQLVKQGLAVARFYEPDVKYKDEIIEAEKQAIENEIGCKWRKTPLSPMSSKEFEKLTAEKTGLEVVFACNAGNYLGKEIIVEGKIVDTYHDLKSNTVFLNFEKPYPNHCFVGVLFSSDQYKFVQNPEDYYSNETVRIKGKIEEYKGKPEIILKNPAQIEVGK